MKINLNEQILNLYGTPSKKIDGDKKTNESLLLKDIISQTLMTVLKKDEKDTAKDKIDRYELAKKCLKENEIELNIEEVGKLSERINLVYPSPLVIGEFNRIIEKK